MTYFTVVVHGVRMDGYVPANCLVAPKCFTLQLGLSEPSDGQVHDIQDILPVIFTLLKILKYQFQALFWIRYLFIIGL